MGDENNKNYSDRLEVDNGDDDDDYDDEEEDDDEEEEEENDGDDLKAKVKVRLFGSHLQLVGLTKRLPDCYAEVYLADGPLRRNSKFEHLLGKTEM